MVLTWFRRLCEKKALKAIFCKKKSKANVSENEVSADLVAVGRYERKEIS